MDSESGTVLSPSSRSMLMRCWMEKQSEWRKYNWTSRLVSLRRGTNYISYKEEAALPDKKGGHVTGLQSFAMGPSQPQSDSDKLRVFKVWVDGTECWTLRTNNKETCREWTDAIAEGLLREQKKNSLSPSNGGEQRNDSAPGENETGSSILHPDGARHVKLTETVAKRSYWRHAWRTRVLSLPETGTTVRYGKTAARADTLSATVIGIDSVGPSADGGNFHEVSFTIASGNHFHVRFETAEVAQKWIEEIRARLAKSDAFVWRAVSVVDQNAALGTSALLEAAPAAAYGGGSTAPTALWRIAHASCVVGGRHCFLFGGRCSRGFECYRIPQPPLAQIPGQRDDAARVLLSHAVDNVTYKLVEPVLYYVDLMPTAEEALYVGGRSDVISRPLPVVRPFSESPYVQVFPQPREGSASVCDGGRWIIFGGRVSGSGASALLQDVWLLDFAALSQGGAICCAGESPAVQLAWQRLADNGVSCTPVSEPVSSVQTLEEVSALPPMAFASAVSISDECILITGGTLDGVNATRCAWYYYPGTGRVMCAAPLDESRAQHAAAVVEVDGCISADGTRIKKTFVALVGGVSRLASIESQGGRGRAGMVHLTSFPVSVCELDKDSGLLKGPWTGLMLRMQPPRTRLGPIFYPAVVAPTQGTRDTLIVLAGDVTAKSLPSLFIFSFIPGGPDKQTLAGRPKDPGVNTELTLAVAELDTLGDNPVHSVGMQLHLVGQHLYAIGGEGLRRIFFSPLLEGNEENNK